MRNLLTMSSKLCLLFAMFVLAVGTVWAQPGSGNIKLRRAMDTDGDFKADYMVVRPSDNTWYISRAAGFVSYIWGSFTDDFQTPGDYDGDLKGDIAVFRDSTGQWFILNSLNSTYTTYTWGASGDEAVARDYDGDGKTDVAVIRRAGGVMTWYILKSDGTGTLTFTWGVPDDFATPGDYDGDGKFDIAVQRPGATPTADSTFHILGSQDGYQAITWGIGDDYVVPGDYDGDGKTDVAVNRAGTLANPAQTWYIRKSSDGGLMQFTWGDTATDLTVQNDYDGDNKTDIAVWRTTTGEFFILRSSDGGFTSATWGCCADFPVAGYDTH